MSSAVVHQNCGFQLLIIENSKTDLSLFDFSDWDIYLADIENPDFKKFIVEMSSIYAESNFQFFDLVIQRRRMAVTRTYVIYKKNYTQDYDVNNLIAAYDLLSILTPSSLHLSDMVDFEIDNNTYEANTMGMSSFGEFYSYGQYWNHFEIKQNKIPIVNSIIKNLYPEIVSNKWLDIAIYNYMTARNANQLHYKFISLCMVLESLISGNTELSYRIRRLVAICVGDNAEECRIIFSNVNELYKLRSKIVHGEKYDGNKLHQYTTYIESLVSELLIELLNFKINSSDKLGETITELGFGEKRKISNAQPIQKINITSCEIVRTKI